MSIIAWELKAKVIEEMQNSQNDTLSALCNVLSPLLDSKGVDWLTPLEEILAPDLLAQTVEHVES
jgi:hypothetical protein